MTLTASDRALTASGRGLFAGDSHAEFLSPLLRQVVGQSVVPDKHDVAHQSPVLGVLSPLPPDEPRRIQGLQGTRDGAGGHVQVAFQRCVAHVGLCVAVRVPAQQAVQKLGVAVQRMVSHDAKRGHRPAQALVRVEGVSWAHLLLLVVGHRQGKPDRTGEKHDQPGVGQLRADVAKLLVGQRNSLCQRRRLRLGLAECLTGGTVRLVPAGRTRASVDRTTPDTPSRTRG